MTQVSAPSLESALQRLLTANPKTEADRLATAMAESKKGAFEKNDFWQVNIGKDSTGYAVIRLLPTLHEGKLPWGRVYRHSFHGPGGRWYIDNCATTLGQPCPVCDENSRLWNAPGGDESPGKKIVRGVGNIPGRKRRMQVIVNILILEHQGVPADSGRVVQAAFGPSIWKIIETGMNPKFKSDLKINPFSLLGDGANFVIRAAPKGEYVNFESSSFQPPSALYSEIADPEKRKEAISKVLSQMPSAVHSHEDPAKFPKYDDAKAKLLKALEVPTDGPRTNQAPNTPAPSPAPQVVPPVSTPTTSPTPVAQATTPAPAAPKTAADESGELSLEDFQNMLNAK